jgi:predicted O-methyltransferase YrrM
MRFDLEDVRALAESFDPDQPTGDPFLDGRYDAQVAKFGTQNAYWRFFYRLCEAYKPDLCCELGAWQGTCAAHMAPHSGTVATIDHHGDPGDDENERLCREVQQRYGNVFYLKGWTWDRWADVRDLGKRIDVLFIDSWHQYEYMVKDWYTYKPLLADEALIVADDLVATDSGPTIAGTLRAWTEICAGREQFTTGRPHVGVTMGFMRWTGQP